MRSWAGNVLVESVRELLAGGVKVPGPIYIYIYIYNVFPCRAAHSDLLSAPGEGGQRSLPFFLYFIFVCLFLQYFSCEGLGSISVCSKMKYVYL